jgi:hypothetical protein
MNRHIVIEKVGENAIPCASLFRNERDALAHAFDLVTENGDSEYSPEEISGRLRDDRRFEIGDWAVYIAESEDPGEGDARETPWRDDRNTNVGRILHLMEWSRCGGLMQAFVIEALGSYADYLLRTAEDYKKKNRESFINPEAWVACAQEVADMFREARADNRRKT